MVLVITGNSFMLLEAKTLNMKYRVELQHIKQISLSNYSDHIFVIHIDPVRDQLHTAHIADTCNLFFAV